MDQTRKDPTKAPTLPQRPQWDADMAFYVAPRSSTDTLKGVMQSWTQWADRVDEVFRQMNEQTEELEVSEDDFIKFIWMFSNHPPRPTLQGIQGARMHGEPVTRESMHQLLAKLHCRWNEFADKLERTYSGMATELARCKLRPFSKAYDGGDFGMSELSLSTGMSTRSQLQAILRHMLGPGRAFQAVHALEENELATGIGQIHIRD